MSNSARTGIVLLLLVGSLLIVRFMSAESDPLATTDRVSSTSAGTESGPSGPHLGAGLRSDGGFEAESPGLGSAAPSVEDAPPDGSSAPGPVLDDGTSGVSGDESEREAIELSLEGATIIARSIEGGPVGGAAVSLLPFDRRTVARGKHATAPSPLSEREALTARYQTDPIGVARFGFESLGAHDGAAAIWVSKPGYRAMFWGDTLEFLEMPIEFNMEPTPNTSALVLGPDGVPVEGALLEVVFPAPANDEVGWDGNLWHHHICGTFYETYESSEDGRVYLPCPPVAVREGHLLARARFNGLASAWTPIAPGEDRVVQLGASFELTCTIENLDHFLENWGMFDVLRVEREDPEVGWVEVQLVTFTDEGKLGPEPIPFHSGQRYRAWLQTVWGAPKPEVFRPSAGERVDLALTVEMGRSGKLRAWNTGRAGERLEQLIDFTGVMRLETEGGPVEIEAWRSTKSADGSQMLPGVQDGVAFYVDVEAPGMAPVTLGPIHAESLIDDYGTILIDAVMCEAAALKGRVLGSYQPPLKLLVVPDSYFLEAFESEFTVAEDGSFMIDAAPAGVAWFAAIDAEGRWTEPRMLDASIRESLELEFTNDRAFIQLVDKETLEPIVDASVQLQSTAFLDRPGEAFSTWPWSTSSDDDGRVVLPFGVNPSRSGLRFTATKEGYLTVSSLSDARIREGVYGLEPQAPALVQFVHETDLVHDVISYSSAANGQRHPFPSGGLIDLSAVPAGESLLGIVYDDFRAAIVADFRSLDPEAPIVLDGPGRVEIRVHNVDPSDSRALSVWLWSSAEGPTRMGRFAGLDSDGSTEMSFLPLGVWSVIIGHAAEELTQPVRVELTPDSPNAQVDIDLSEEGWLFEVVDSRGEPQADARLVLQGGRVIMTAYTDLDGRARVQLPRLDGAEYTVSAALATGASILEEPLEQPSILSESTPPTRLVLSDDSSVRVGVFHHGEPVEGAKVFLAGSAWKFEVGSTLTGADGFAELVGLGRGPARFGVRAPGYQLADFVLELQGGAIEHQLEVWRASKLLLRVLDGDGVPLEGASVEYYRPEAGGVALRDERNVTYGIEPADSVTDGRGEVLYEMLPEVELDVVVGFGGRETRVALPVPRPEVVEVTFDVPATAGGR
jgi:hypothetical protein